MKKLNDWLNIIMGSFFGVFIGRTISNYQEYRNYPEIYVSRSAPWYYYGSLQSLVLFFVVVIICVGIKVFIKHRDKQKDKE